MKRLFKNTDKKLYSKNKYYSILQEDTGNKVIHEKHYEKVQKKKKTLLCKSLVCFTLYD